MTTQKDTQKHKPSALFATPDSMDYLEAWINEHDAETRLRLHTVMGMYYNLIVANFDLVPKETP